MKAKIGRGNGFRGLANYILDEEKGAEYLGGNMISKTPKDLAKEFSVCRKLRPDIKNPVWHASLSLPSNETIDNEKWLRLSKRFLELMSVEVDNHQYFTGKHIDTDNEHIHIEMNRIGFNGELFHGRNDVMQAIKATHQLEKEFGLILTVTFDPEYKAEKKKVTSNEIQMSARTGELPARISLQNILDEALTEQIDVFAFIERCESAGATAIPNVARTGRLNGFAFEYEGIKFKGSELGAKYTYKNLKEVVIYEQDRQSNELIEKAKGIKQRLNEVNERSAGQEQPELEEHKPNDRGIKGFSAEINRDSFEFVEAANIDETNISSEQERADNSNKRNDRSREGTEKAEQFGNERDQTPLFDDRFNDWNVVNDFIDDLAAPVTSVSSKNKSSNILKKESAWVSQHKALKADAYRITLIGRNGQKPWVLGKSKDGEKFFNADEVKAKIPLLSKKNAEGRDIYITPRALNHHYIVLDDLTPGSYKEMLGNGYKPNLVQESSKDNYQAIFRVPMSGDKDDRKIANKIVVGLNKKYGDPKFTGVEHPFRMSGFSNKKATRNNFFTQLITSAEKACERIISLLNQELNKVIKQREAKKANEKPLKKVALDYEQERIDKMNSVGKNTKTSSAVFARNWSKWHGLARKNGWAIDFSRIDFSATKDMIKGGYNDTEIKIAITDCSPSILNRKHDIQDYCDRTVVNAKNQIERDKYKANQNNGENELGL